MHILDFINIISIQPLCVGMAQWASGKKEMLKGQSSVAMEIKYNIMSWYSSLQFKDMDKVESGKLDCS